MGLKKIVLITTGQPSINPRVVKEADALYAAGYDVTLLYCYFIEWATATDIRLLQQVQWKHRMVGGSPAQNKGTYFFTRLRNKAASLLGNFFDSRFLLAERTQVRAFDELLKEAKKIKADWYIGHNLGALPVAVKAARYHNAKAGFDFEDYHRGELLPTATHALKRLAFLENKYLPFLNYFSGSSAMITAAVQKDHPGFKGMVITLLNCFPLDQQPPFKEKPIDDDTLQLFWFSQTVGINRGLEQVVKGMAVINDPTIHLTLAGRCDAIMLKFIELNAGNAISNIHFAGIIEPGNLPEFASGFDVGMATEPGFSDNNNFALSNKIFTYLLAGNAIILTETDMQSAFNKQYKVGESFVTHDINELIGMVIGFKNTDKLNSQKKYNYELAKNNLNWNKESNIFLSMLASC